MFATKGSAHNDFSPLLCLLPKEKERQHVQGNVHLPERDEMQVLTIHYSNFDNPTTNHCTTLSYTHNSSSIGSFPLPSRGIHIQGPGSQSAGIKHKVSVNPQANQPGIFCWICSTRLTIAPKHGNAFSDRMELEGFPSYIDEEG
jgi:hypothetical protein